jgi:glyoxylase-like metal-dependent hydrolase (beta-lactamase superfamily II)
MQVHAIRTGSVQVRPRQVEATRSGLRRRLDPLLDRRWTEPLPILAWAIEHPEGVVVVDAGETARVGEAGYFPRWHPYFHLAVRFDVTPGDEIGPRLRALGIAPEDVRTVVLTHLHTDHAGGLHHFPRARVLVSEAELAVASGLRGRLEGYLPHRRPSWLSPVVLPLARGEAPEPFELGAVVADGIRAVATPGHTPGHVSVLVEGDPPLVIAGDVSYTLDTMLRQRLDGVSPDDTVARATLARMRAYVERTGAAYLPSHDPESAARLAAARQSSR